MPPESGTPDCPEAIARRLGWPVPDRYVDAQGMMCPQPLLLARRAVDELPDSGFLLIGATDPHALLDFEVYCRRSGHQLIGHQLDGDILYLMLQVNSADD